MRARLPILALACLCLVSEADAQDVPPNAKEATATRLHEQALKARERGKRKAAIDLWKAAQHLHHHWKYAYNLCAVLLEDGRYLDAWRACDDAERLGFPDEHQAKLTQNRSRIRGKLSADHVFIELHVSPEQADVTRDSQPWPAPRAMWTRDVESRIEVTSEGFETKKLTWKKYLMRWKLKVRIFTTRII